MGLLNGTPPAWASRLRGAPLKVQTNLFNLRWLNTVLRAVSGNSRDGKCFNLDKQTWRRKSNGTQKTKTQNLLIKIL